MFYFTIMIILFIIVLYYNYKTYRKEVLQNDEEGVWKVILYISTFFLFYSIIVYLTMFLKDEF